MARVVPRPLSEPDKWLSHIRLLGRSFSKPPSRLSISDLCSWLDHSLYSGPVSSSTVNLPWEPSLRGHYPSSSLTVAVYRFPSLATRPSEHLLLHWWPYSGTVHCAFPQEPLIVARLVARLPLYRSMLSETPGGRSALVTHAPPTWPTPDLKGSALTQTTCFSGLRCRFRASLFTSRYALIFPSSLRLPVITLPSG
jgi:hypothetical protein